MVIELDNRGVLGSRSDIREALAATWRRCLPVPNGWRVSRMTASA